MFKFNIVSRYRYSLVAATTKAAQNKTKKRPKQRTSQLTLKSNRTWLIDATFIMASAGRRAVDRGSGLVFLAHTFTTRR